MESHCLERASLSTSECGPSASSGTASSWWRAISLIKLRRRLSVGRDWPLMSLIFTTPMRTTPAVLGATTGAGGCAGGVATGLAGGGAGSGAVSECAVAGAPPIMADTSMTLQPGGMSNSGASKFVLVSSTTSVVVVNVPWSDAMVVVSLSG